MYKKIGIIGAGVVGTAIAIILARKGFEITGAFDLKPESTKRLKQFIPGIVLTSAENVSRSADILLITTPDDAIKKVADELAGLKAFHEKQIVVHLSGVHSSKILDSIKDFKAIAMSMHPLQSLADVEQAVKNLPGSVFSIEGDSEGYEVVIFLIETLGGEYFIIDTEAKPLYHAGACIVSNYLVTLADLGVKLLRQAGIDGNMALRGYLPLMAGTVNNLGKLGLPDALTGPIARGDMDTVRSHMESLEKSNKKILKLYCDLGVHTAEIAARKGGISESERLKWQELFEKKLR
ncbi:MAG: DUF2520 domain-containing protein [Syntrophomonadaceae bacterium]|jgi:predicted short-subunit dehydrogenase-like oxidoreductase (DUF2520 family)|nr:DUF2520 domain-containing protein [Syntrophomonadaceae bacterium]